MGRILGIDYGERRIGVAVSDPTGTIASPVGALTRRAGKRPPWAELERLVREHEIEQIVVGLPLNLAGDESDWCREVRAFGERLAARTGLAVHWVDERMSSVEAERAVRSSGLRRGQREEKERVDAAAAAIILRSYLERRRSDMERARE
jgi:putative holliday junction resolvase